MKTLEERRRRRRVERGFRCKVEDREGIAVRGHEGRK